MSTSISEEKGEELIEAMEANNYEAVQAWARKYQDKIGDFSMPDGTPLVMQAISKKNHKILIALVLAGANWNVSDRTGRTALRLAEDEHDIVAQRLLLGFDLAIQQYYEDHPTSAPRTITGVRRRVRGSAEEERPEFIGVTPGIR